MRKCFVQSEIGGQVEGDSAVIVVVVVVVVIFVVVITAFIVVDVGLLPMFDG